MSSLKNMAIKRIHSIGIGGIGVSGLAEILHARGFVVSGSDAKASILTERLQAKGLQISIGHDAKNVADADLIVYSSAIDPNNPEMQAALAKNIPCIQRGQLLAELMQQSIGVAIAGTHGKTTTTGLIGHICIAAKTDPTLVMGGILNQLQSNTYIGTGKYFIAEADESDASFLHMRPHIAVVTNIDVDHLESYEGDFAKLKQSFIRFLNNLPQDGLAIVGIDDPVARELLPKITVPVQTFGFSEQANLQCIEYRQEGLVSYIKVKYHAQVYTMQVNLPGRHNVLNALASILAALSVGVSWDEINKALANFKGVGRRFYAHGTIKVKNGRALLFDDYGHHPREVNATLQAAKQAWPDRRLVLVFQPHRYTRTRDLMQGFAESLSAPDVLILLDVYSAGEAPIVNADGLALCAAIKKMGKLKPVFVSDENQLFPILQDILQDNDIVLFQGAGSIGPMAWSFASEWVDESKKN